MTAAQGHLPPESDETESERQQTMDTTTQLFGVLPVVQTPFAEDGSIDVGALDHELGWVLDQHVDGLATGMVSEIPRLTSEERRLLAERVCAAANSRGRLSVISCGAESLRSAIAHALHAEENEASGLMVNSPLTVTLDDVELYDYFARIAKATSLPVVVQDASGYIGRPLSIDLQAQLFSDFSERIAFKPEAQPIGPTLSRLRDATGAGAAVFEGSGGASIIDSYRRGIVGTMPGAEVCWAVRALWDAARTGDWPLAYRISGPLNTLVAMQTTVDGYVALEKHILWRQGVFPRNARRPPNGFSVDAETAEEVDRLVDQLAEAVGRDPLPPAG